MTTPYASVCAAASAAAKQVGPACPQCNQTIRPIKHGTGRKYIQELPVSTPTLKLDLTYDSTPANLLPMRLSPFGKGWAFNYGMRVWIMYANAALVLRPDGKFYEFAPPASGNTYISNADVPDTLTKVVSGTTITGFQYKRAADETIENYDANGILLSIVQRNAQTTTFTYSISTTPTTIAPRAGLLITVTDHFGRTLQFIYDASARIKSATDPVGNQFDFFYDEASSFVLTGQPLGNNLTSIQFPGLHKRIFYYNEQSYTASTNLANALTGITDENGERYSIYQYDATGRAVSSGLAGGVETSSVVYNADGTSLVTDPLGTARTFGYQIVQRVSQTTSISGPACPSCGPAVQTFDPNGFIESVTDWNGNLTTYLRQDPYGRLDLETSRTEALGSPQARTITTQWHPTFRLPATVTEPGRSTTFIHDPDNGNVLSRTVTDTLVTNKSRTWTYTYATIGRVQTIDGPRTDVSDVTAYVYYSDNDPDLGRRGNLHTITNALSQVTSITSYDANGRPLTIVDPNGLSTTLTYAPRGWLATRTVGAELTTYDYDFVGQLTRVTLPDTSFLHYTYDAAHRLIQIDDQLGNKIVYTPDNMGNRTREEVFDPSNALAQTRSRVYSSLNRLFQDIGGTSPATQITQYGYDNQGNLTTITVPLHPATTNGYDALNRLKQVTDPNLGVTQYSYNALDQLTSVTDPRNNATSDTLDALDNLTQQLSPDTGTTINTPDDAGNVLTSVDAKSQATTNTYDALNRLTQATYQDGSQNGYAYDVGPNGKGRLTSITEKAPGGAIVTQTTYTYDVQGRVLTDTRLIGAVNFVTGYGYEASGRLQTLTYPSRAARSA